MDFYLQIISLVAYSTIILRTTWIFVPNRFPKLPADKKWPNYVITFFHVLAVVILLITSGLYYFDDSKDFGDEFREMDREIRKVEVLFDSTSRRLMEIGNPDIRFDGLHKITEDIKTRTGFGVIESEAENQKNFLSILNDIFKWQRNTSEPCVKKIDHYKFMVTYDLYERDDTKIWECSNSNIINFNILKQNLEPIIDVKQKELENLKPRIAKHSVSANIFFEKFVASMKKSRHFFGKMKEKSIKMENSKNIVLLSPFLFAFLFSLLSIITNIIWGKNIPRVLSIILCILFHIISIQVVIISTYFAYNIPEDIFTREPEYFKLFDFEMSSYDNKSVTNAYKALLNGDHRNSAIFSRLEHGIFMPDYPLLHDLHDILSETVKLKDLCNPQSRILSGKGILLSYKNLTEQLNKPKNCPEEVEKKRQEYVNSLNATYNYIGSWLELITDNENITRIIKNVIDDRVEEVNRLIYQPIFQINQTLFLSNFKCQPLYNALLNGFISSHTPDQNSYRNMFKISVMGCSTLCLVLYLLEFGRRIQPTSDSESPTGPSTMNNKSPKMEKGVVARSPKRF